MSEWGGVTEKGQYLCEQCQDAMTDLVVIRDGVEQACCAGCQEGAAVCEVDDKAWWADVHYGWSVWPQR